MEQVKAWVRSLNPAYEPYLKSFESAGVTGKMLLKYLDDAFLSQTFTLTMHLNAFKDELAELRAASAAAATAAAAANPESTQPPPPTNSAQTKPHSQSMTLTVTGGVMNAQNGVIGIGDVIKTGGAPYFENGAK